MNGYLATKEKSRCFGCEACVQVCNRLAINMKEDEEGFRYPIVDQELCVNCGACNKVCPNEYMPQRYQDDKVAFGGYHSDNMVKDVSTSGGAFSAIVETWCVSDYVIFGAEAKGLDVYHNYVHDKKEIAKFRKSKYSQSVIGTSYKAAKQFLVQGKSVVFSGTPCQIAGLKAFLGNTDQTKLLTIEVVCEGVPSPHFVRRYDEFMQKRYGSEIENLDYRYKDSKFFGKTMIGKWDFEVMKTVLKNGKTIQQDRWFNSFWSIWLNHLMSRPSCYECPFTNTARVADVTLGDLWGVHLYCPELYGNNGGSSLVIGNTEKGKLALEKAKERMYGHDLIFDQALKYQSPMRKCIDYNPERNSFMQDLVDMDYVEICNKWAKRPTMKLLWQKYVWGNRQKIFVWNLKKRVNEKFGKGEKHR